MGLDITSLSRILTKESNPIDFEFRELLEETVETFYINPEFYDQCSNYTIEGQNTIEYIRMEESMEIEFKAGSYRGYNEWRRQLCEFANDGLDIADLWDNFDKYKDAPFASMLNFSDCEGALDYLACEGLLKDFIDNKDVITEKVKAHTRMGEMDKDHWIEIYDSFTQAMSCASNEGVMIFH